MEICGSIITAINASRIFALHTNLRTWKRARANRSLGLRTVDRTSVGRVVVPLGNLLVDGYIIYYRIFCMRIRVEVNLPK